MNPTMMTTTSANAGPKPWYASAGVWGAVVTLAGSVLALFKLQLDPALLDAVREWVLALATLLGGGVALWGRIRATRRIGTSPRDGGPGASNNARPESSHDAGPGSWPDAGSRNSFGVGPGILSRVQFVTPLDVRPASLAADERAATVGRWRPGVSALTTVAMLLLAVGSGGCALLSTPDGPQIAAERATYDAIAPEYRAYVATDENLTEEQRGRRERTVELWRARVEDAQRRADSEP